MFLYVSVSTLNPMVGIVLTTVPTCRRYRIVVFPALSRPSTKMRASFSPNACHRRENKMPMVSVRFHASRTAPRARNVACGARGEERKVSLRFASHFSRSACCTERVSGRARRGTVAKPRSFPDDSDDSSSQVSKLKNILTEHRMTV